MLKGRMHSVVLQQVVKGHLRAYNSWNEYKTLLKLVLYIIHESYFCDI